MRRIVIITVSPVPALPNYFEARWNGGLLCVSAKPFLDGARRLLELGQDPCSALIMRGPESPVHRLRSTINVAARHTIAEGEMDPPRFRRWKGPHSREGSPPSAHFELPATTPPSARSIVLPTECTDYSAFRSKEAVAPVIRAPTDCAKESRRAPASQKPD
jgi:hypothetical protein